MPDSPDVVEVSDNDLSDDEPIKGIALPSDDESPPRQDADQTGEAADDAEDAA